MIRFGIDANVVLRALLNDHPSQSAIARELLGSLGEERRAYLGIPALLDVFWVLRSRYRVPREELCDTMRRLLMTNHLDIESSDAVVRALAHYEKRRADFQDALLAGRNAEAGCERTFTFDKDGAKSVPEMDPLS